MTLRRAALVVAIAALAAAACTPPESARTRGGGPGADVGNRRDDVRVRERVDVERGVPDRKGTP